MFESISLMSDFASYTSHLQGYQPCGINLRWNFCISEFGGSTFLLYWNENDLLCLQYHLRLKIGFLLVYYSDFYFPEPFSLVMYSTIFKIHSHIFFKKFLFCFLAFYQYFCFNALSFINHCFLLTSATLSFGGNTCTSVPSLFTISLYLYFHLVLLQIFLSLLRVTRWVHLFYTLRTSIFLGTITFYRKRLHM